MKTKEINKIAEVLILSGSELREETIERYTEFVIKLLDKCSKSQEIVDYTKSEFDVSLNIGEVDNAIQNLVDVGKVLLNNGYWSLSETASLELEKILDAEYEQQLTRLEDFKKSFKSYGIVDVKENELESMFSIYNEYIIECIFIYGKLTSITVTDSDKNLSDNDLNSVLISSLKKIKSQKLKNGFETFIKELPECLTGRELNYIETLSNRAENFFALGLSKELANSFYQLQPLEWVILLDTNVLYSILKIRDHSENPAVLQLLDIFIKWKDYFKITLRYLPDTYEELKLAKGELDNRVSKSRLTPNHINAALRADKVDDFTKAYYQNMLEYGDAAVHPSDILTQSINILRSKHVERYQSKFSSIDVESEEFKDLLSSYNTFQQIKNESRREKGFTTRDKSIHRIEHDVFLREAVKSLREKNCPLATHFQECKYFGLTLDKVLIDFDKYNHFKINKDTATYVPVFFLPSVLLKRIYRFVPVQSDDYKKAFISSITKPIFSSKVTTERSKLTQNALNRFYALGIDDPNFILKSVTNDLFVKELSDKTEEVEAFNFIESEINKQLKEADKSLTKTKKELDKTQEAYSEKSEQLDVSLERLGDLANKERVLQEDIDFLMKQLQKVQQKVDKAKEQKTELVQASIPFDQASADKKFEKATKIAKELNADKRKQFLSKEYQKWKWRPIYLLMVLIFVGILIILSILAIHEWNSDLAYQYYADLYKKHPSWKVLIYVSLGFIAIIDLFIFREIHKRWLDFKHIEAFKESIEIPKDLRDDFIEEQLK